MTIKDLIDALQATANLLQKPYVAEDTPERWPCYEVIAVEEKKDGTVVMVRSEMPEASDA